jgi:predicted dithiol-disulfide oxidoreductase (DUF899 family)
VTIWLQPLLTDHLERPPDRFDEQQVVERPRVPPRPRGRCSSFIDNAGHLTRDGDDVYRTYFTTARGVGRLRFDFNLLDLTAFGRQEEWEDSPEGRPQSKPSVVVAHARRVRHVTGRL